jgi:hypothetical protein
MISDASSLPQEGRKVQNTRAEELVAPQVLQTRGSEQDEREAEDGHRAMLNARARARCRWRCVVCVDLEKMN